MRIASINSIYGAGSTGRIMLGIERLILDSGNEAFVAFGYGGSGDSRHHKIINRVEFYRHNLLSRLTDRQALFSSSHTRRLIKRLGEFNPDILHLHNLHGSYINYELLFNYIHTSGVKVVWSLHDCWAFTGHCAHFDFIKCERWQTGCLSCPQHLSYPMAITDRSRENYRRKYALINKVTSQLTLVPVSHWLDNLVSKSMLGKCRRKVIHNGIDLHEFRRVTYDFDKPYVLGVSYYWNDRKGLDDFIKLRSLLSEQIDIKLIGLTRRQIKSLPAGITGYQKISSMQELSRYYSNAITLINASYEDTYPTVNLEAIACGTPVVTYNTGGSPESVLPDCGIVVDKGDILALADAAMSIYKDKNFEATVLRDYAERNFDRNRCFAEYIDLYREIIAR